MLLKTLVLSLSLVFISQRGKGGEGGEGEGISTGLTYFLSSFFSEALRIKADANAIQ